MLHLPRNMHGRSDWTRYWRAGALLVILISAGVTAALAAGPAEPHHVTAVRFWSLGAVTRIAIETDGDFEVKSDRLDNPDRLFFDLSPTRPDLSHKSLTVIPVSDHLVRQIRVAEPQHNVTRVVLDLETQVEHTLSRLDNPSRLIIELRAKGAPRETTNAPLKSPSTLVEPAPVSKPVERRPFTPPPAAQPIAIPAASPQEAWLDTPPELPLRSVLPPVSSLLSVSFKTAAPPPYSPLRPRCSQSRHCRRSPACHQALRRLSRSRPHSPPSATLRATVP